MNLSAEQAVQTASGTRVRFLGARLADSTTMEDVIARIDGAIRSRAPHRVVALNVPKLWRMEHDERLRTIMEHAEMLLPEPMIALASRLTGHPLRSYIGNDQLTHRLLRVADERHYRLFFLGTRPEILQRLSDRVLAQHAGLQIAGRHHGFFTAAEEECVAAAIRASQADIVFVGMGTPRQEYWMQDWGTRLGAPVVIGVGGTLDVLAGLKSHCPRWLRAAGLEWVYRMLEDPRGKAARYLRVLPWFAWTLLTEGLIPRCFPVSHAENR